MKKWRNTDQIIVMSDLSQNNPMDSDYWYLNRNSINAYREMAIKINQSDISVVSLQHEFGIFGGKRGHYILEFIKHLKKPLITTFHTVRPNLPPSYLRLLKEISLRSEAVIVISQSNAQFLHQKLFIPKQKIFCIPHGSPQPLNQDRDHIRKELNWAGKRVILSFGLLRPGKGMKFAIECLPDVVKAMPNTEYYIVGETHPAIKKRRGEGYRKKLQRTINRLGLKNHVFLINQYLKEKDLIRYIPASDLIIVPYPNLHRNSSGVLSYAVSMGKPLLATPFSYAKEVLGKHKELMLPYGDHTLWSKKLISILSDPLTLNLWRDRIRKTGESLHWPQIAAQHIQVFEQIHSGHV
ncbi:glycosyltransferase [Ammoniphilus sp. CFH 90114]|uniref:glycosyltransferase n=1 Tax=Ammoniphilus sp. CFH 90114 TaxID=2493665 RepID=UPI0013E94448|nr:glycosyltransferase [Ammoniphilus sp. CFH 90114]